MGVLSHDSLLNMSMGAGTDNNREDASGQP
jgi:hypothetical protein